MPLTLGRRQDGATAIEYALLAALIGLGIVGSLLTTKSSVQFVLNASSSGLAKAGSNHPAVAASPSATYWQSKRLVSMTPSNVSPSGGTYIFKYDDNTTVLYTVSWNPDGTFAGNRMEYQSNLGGYAPSDTIVNYDANGWPYNVSVTSYRDYSNTVSVISSAGAPDWRGNQIYFDSYGNVGAVCGSGQCYQPTGSLQGWANDALYYRGVVSQY